MEAQALILAAGAGTRMKSSKPKVLHELLGKPLVRWAVDAARAAGCSQVHAVIGNGREQVEPVLADCAISYQLELLGTGHTVMCAADKLAGFAGTLVVLCGDSPLIRPQTISSLIAYHEEQSAACTVLTMRPANPHGYGRIVRGEGGGVTGIVEQKDCTPEQAAIGECNSGAYCFSTPKLLERLGRLTTNNAQGEYYLTDILGLMVGDGLTVAGYVVEDDTECMGVNSRGQLAQATAAMQRRINEHWMAQGVTMLDPSQVWIGPDVTLGRDCELLPQTMLWGSTSIGEGCTLGPNTRLTDCLVANDCVLEETVAIRAKLDEDVSCGPRAYLREGTHMGPNSKAGTCVEIKKSKIGQGSKVPHLSYIGDCDMGPGVNIGAGSITCNYDGANKHKTTIGANAFIGSDTMMVAPVSIGDDALVAAGSVITQDVPDGALALGRARQVNKEGYRKA
ncbi:MAG: bifunctional UDP-N-acetylglucosamine diphosphorylase/glucosamine-1-phosphate N-acetyltransferase GlmU [Coriobacteriales bacterium]